MQALLFSEYADEAAVLTVILQQAGFQVRSIKDLNRAIELWPEQPAELAVISTARDEPSVSLHVEQIRAQTAVTIVVITELLLEDIQVRLYEAGADMVVSKPFSNRLLLAQIRAILRRTAGMPFFSLPTLSQGDVSLDPSSRTVMVGSAIPTHLTHLEFRLLYTLMTHVGQIIPTQNIVEHVWGYTGEGNRELVRGLVQRLRSKVEPEPRNPQYICTEPGVGYYFSRYQEP